MVIWLLGMSGSGKTTLGNKLKDTLDKKQIKNCIIDGDIVRDFYDNDLGYTKQDRVANIKRIMLSVYLLEQNGIVPIVCNISPYQDLRDFARNKFEEYVEVYLKRNIEDIKNKKQVYDGVNVVGVDQKFDDPIMADLIINTSSLSIQESIDKILSFTRI